MIGLYAFYYESIKVCYPSNRNDQGGKHGRTL